MAFQTQTQNRSVLAIHFVKSQPSPPVLALNRSSKSQIAARYAAFGARSAPNRIGLFPLAQQHRSVLKSQHLRLFKTQNQPNRKRERFINRSVLVPLRSQPRIPPYHLPSTPQSCSKARESMQNSPALGILDHSLTFSCLSWEFPTRPCFKNLVVCNSYLEGFFCALSQPQCQHEKLPTDKNDLDN